MPLTQTPTQTFSIIIPAWKTLHLQEALDSARRQQVPGLEILVVDDHSPEDVESVVRGAADPRLRYVRLEENLGRNDPSLTWNKGLELARGTFVVLLGDDDRLSDNYLLEMEALVSRHPQADLFRTRLEIIGADGSLVATSPEHPELEAWDLFMYARNQYRHPVSTSEMCARTSALRDLGGYASMPLALGSDDLTWLKLALRHPVVSTNAAHACWRVHPQSICGRVDRAEARILAMERALAAELEIIDLHAPTRLPRQILREAAVRHWEENIRWLRRQSATRPRRWIAQMAALCLRRPAGKR